MKTSLIGERLREARQTREWSLTQVAAKAKMSAATLSRIENEKQALDITTLFSLAKILGVPAEELVAENGNGRQSKEDAGLAQTIAAMPARERTRLWQELTDRRSGQSRRKENRDLEALVEELVAQLEFVRAELESVRARLKLRRR